MSRNCRQIGIDQSGILFLSCTSTPYVSLDAHRSPSSTRHPKSIWKVSRPDECHTFCIAETDNTVDIDGNYWTITNENSPDLGTRGERMGFFQRPVNPTDPWHGFPVGGSRMAMKFRRPPPDTVVENWYQTGRISYTTYTRILTRRM